MSILFLYYHISEFSKCMGNESMRAFRIRLAVDNGFISSGETPLSSTRIWHLRDVKSAFKFSS